MNDLLGNAWNGFIILFFIGGILYGIVRGLFELTRLVARLFGKTIQPWEPE